ncbi:MAG: topoisomerase [Gammaproteobacteria bacterium]|nr:MAG: topoisomerase [Gammaproteobacteria bacterium]
MRDNDFRDAILSAGLTPPDYIEPGRLYRFPGQGKRRKNRAGWCLLFPDGKGGIFGDWSTGYTETWQAQRHRPMTAAERANFERLVKAAKAKARAEQAARYDEAAERAQAIWDKAKPAPAGHPYLVRKRIKPHTARLHRASLVLPVVDFTGRLVSLQFIKPDGSKLLLSGGRKRGCFIPVDGDLEQPERAIVCEGWGTGCTLAEDEPAALVLAAIDAGNLKPVALSARQRWPNTELVIAGDDDRRTPGNPGRTKALEAARAVGCLVAFPEWPKDAPEALTDFNDLAAWQAGGAV